MSSVQLQNITSRHARQTHWYCYQAHKEAHAYSNEQVKKFIRFENWTLFYLQNNFLPDVWELITSSGKPIFL